MSKPYDPELRKAAEEFKDLCKKYGCMAAVLFVSSTHAEFVNYLNPSWSVMMPEKGGIRFRSKKEDFKSKEEQDRKTTATAHGVTSIVNWSRQTYEGWSNVLNQLQKHMQIVCTVWGKPDSVPGDGL